MATSVELRQIPRDKLFAIFKSEELVRIFEQLLYAVQNTLPTAADDVQANLDAHIADATDAHEAGAIGFTPTGSIGSNNMQAAIAELDTEKQPRDATLTALAALVTAADRLIYATDTDAFALTTFTAFARTLLAGVDAAAMRTTLALGSMATQAANTVAITGGSIALASGTLGYAAGNGGTVTQATNKATNVTLNKMSGDITLSSDALASQAIVSFTLLNSNIAATDVVIAQHNSAGTNGAYAVTAQVLSAGQCLISVKNDTTGSLSEAIVLRFLVLKAATT